MRVHVQLLKPVPGSPNYVVEIEDDDSIRQVKNEIKIDTGLDAH